jgi:hypothetical protein
MGKLEKIPGHAVGIEPTYDFWMILFKLARFGYTLRLTSQALYA